VEKFFFKIKKTCLLGFFYPKGVSLILWKKRGKIQKGLVGLQKGGGGGGTYFRKQNQPKTKSPFLLGPPKTLGICVFFL